jgi:cell wall-associated NlpC family hydrolase
LSFAVFGAAVAPTTPAGTQAGHFRRLLLLLLAAAFAITLLTVAPPAGMQAAAARSDATRIVAAAKSHIGRPWVYAATGPRAFDCSGLVYRVFQETGLVTKIGGRKTAKGYLNWFRQRGLVSRKNPRVGDLIVWGNGTHIGIYVGSGDAISTLTSGVKRHGVFRVTTKFTAYLHVNIGR